jgi:hypothetical protein
MGPLSWKTEPKAFFLTFVYKYTIHLGQHFNISCHFHSKHGTANVSATSHRARREVSPTWSCSSIWFGILRASAERMVISWLVHLRGWEWYRYHPVDFIHIHWKHWSIGQSVKIWQDPSCQHLSHSSELDLQSDVTSQRSAKNLPSCCTCCTCCASLGIQRAQIVQVYNGLSMGPNIGCLPNMTNPSAVS